MSLRIGIDLFQLVPGVGRGAGFHRYTTGLMNGLAELSDDHRYYLFVNRLNAGMFPSGPRFRHVVIPLPPSRAAWPFRLGWHHALLPLLARRYRLDVVHFPMDTASFALGRPYVVTIHDLISDVFYPNHYPESVGWLKARYLFAAKQHSGRHARAVICPSRATAHGVRMHYGVPSDRTVVIAEGIHPLFFEGGAAPAHAGGDRPYVLAVSSLSPHKNLPGMVRAFLWAREAFQLPHELRIIGMRGTDARPIERYLAAEQARGLPVRYLGFVDDRTLRDAYRRASLLIYVSQTEGFGLPPLEAMASGTPVIASNVSSLPEVCGGAARLVSPEDTEGLANAIGEVLTDASVASRLKDAGRERARGFSWTATAEQTRAVFERVAGVRPSGAPAARPEPPAVSRRPRIGAVVVNWNGWASTLECLESLRRAGLAADRIAVVTPGRDHGAEHHLTPPWAARVGAAADIHLVTADETSFAAAANAGLAALDRQSDITHFATFDGDMIVEPDFFDQLAAVLERVPDAGLVGATIYEVESPGRVWYAGGRVRQFRGKATRLREVPIDIEPRTTEFVSGRAMLISRQAYAHLGGLPDCYAFLPGDVEYSTAALRAALRVVYAPGAVAHHRSGSRDWEQRGQDPAAPVAYFEARNRALYVRRRGPAGVAGWLWLSGVELVGAAVLALRGHGAVASARTAGIVSGLFGGKPGAAVMAAMRTARAWTGSPPAPQEALDLVPDQTLPSGPPRPPAA